MKASKNKKGLSESKATALCEVVDDMPYDNSKKELICTYIIQLLCDKGMNQDFACTLFSNSIDVSKIQESINFIYDESTLPLSINEFTNHITQEEYDAIKKIIDLEDLNIVAIHVDEGVKIRVNFSTKQIIMIKEYYNKKGEIHTKNTPLIEACPFKLIVYDGSLFDLPRTFKIVWESPYSERKFTTAGTGSGATIKEIANYISESGFSHNHRYVHDAVTASINAMIKNNMAIIKHTVDNKGVYYDDDNDKLIVVKLNKDKPSVKAMNDAIEVLFELKDFYNDNTDIFATVFKWTIVSIFNYAMKQVGNNLPWLFLVGTSQSGKTTLANIMGYVYDECLEDISGSQMTSEFRIGNELSKSCVHLSISEPEGLFASEKATALIKHCVYSKISRVVQGKTYPVFSAGIFTSNPNVLTADATFNRMITLFFEYSQRKTNKQIDAFKEKFNHTNPKKSILNKFHAFGEFAIWMLSENTEMLTWDWQKMADHIIHEFFKETGIEYPVWLDVWTESEDIDDFDNSRIDDIRTVLLKEVSFERKRNAYPSGNDLHSEQASISTDFENMIWHFVNERLFTWCWPHIGRNDTKMICLNQNFRKLINNELNISDNLKSLGQLLNWDYSKVNFNKHTKRVLKIPLDEFVNFLYPSEVLDE